MSQDQQQETTVSDTQKHDETAAKYFESGWNSAIREVALRRERGSLDEFMHEQRRALEPAPVVTLYICRHGKVSHGCDDDLDIRRASA